MPCSKTHFMVGAGVGAGLNILKQSTQKVVNPNYQFDVLETMAWAGVGGVIACLPDMLEPALHPNHRSTCHSMAVVIFLLHVVLGKHNREFTSEQRQGLQLIGYPYLSHLLLDALTKKSLPWI